MAAATMVAPALVAVVEPAGAVDAEAVVVVAAADAAGVAVTDGAPRGGHSCLSKLADKNVCHTRRILKSTMNLDRRNRVS